MSGEDQGDLNIQADCDHLVRVSESASEEDYHERQQPSHTCATSAKRSKRKASVLF